MNKSRTFGNFTKNEYLKFFVISICKISTMLNKNIWNPWVIFNQNEINEKYAVIILNTAINLHMGPELLLNIWNNASFRMTVDGGTNHWLSWINKYNIKDIKQPELITGDMDSIQQDTLNYFFSKSVKVITTPDQNETDFTKSLKELVKHIEIAKIEINTILVIVDTCGRFDQIISNINTLFKALYICPNIKVYNLAKESLTWLLDSGQHQIFIPQNLRNNKEWCALLPIGSKCYVTTSGLKWNLNNGLLEFGKMVSTSNTYNGDEHVLIDTDSKLVWSMGIETLFM